MCVKTKHFRSLGLDPSLCQHSIIHDGPRQSRTPDVRGTHNRGTVLVVCDNKRTGTGRSGNVKTRVTDLGWTVVDTERRTPEGDRGPWKRRENILSNFRDPLIVCLNDGSWSRTVLHTYSRGRMNVGGHPLKNQRVRCNTRSVRIQRASH